MQKACAIYLTDDAPLEAVSKRLERRWRSRRRRRRGQLVLRLKDGGEAEIRLPGRFKVTPQIAGAIKAVPGVVQVEAPAHKIPDDCRGCRDRFMASSASREPAEHPI